MRCLIILNARDHRELSEKDAYFYRSMAERSDFVICADGGINTAKAAGIPVDLVVGDMDSAESEILSGIAPERLIKYPSEKDRTDGWLALQKAIEINNVYSDAMNTLTESWLDYLIADKFYLDKAEIIRSDKDIKLKIKGHEFSVLILPPLFVLSRDTSEKVVEFAKAGGRVILLGSLAIASPENGLNDPKILKNMKELRQLASVVDLSGEKDQMGKLSSKLKEVIDPQIVMTKGNLPLKISHRKIDDNDMKNIGKQVFYNNSK